MLHYHFYRLINSAVLNGKFIMAQYELEGNQQTKTTRSYLIYGVSNKRKKWVKDIKKMA